MASHGNIDFPSLYGLLLKLLKYYPVFLSTFFPLPIHLEMLPFKFKVAFPFCVALCGCSVATAFYSRLFALTWIQAWSERLRLARFKP